MNTSDVMVFFDRLAPQWDDNMVRNESVISSILDYAGIREGIDVLDVACGTGVLFSDYKERGVTTLTGIDLSPEMVRIARSKYPDIEVICGDIMTVEIPGLFDSIVVYNALPHFADSASLISVLTNKLKVGGRLTIAHGMSREKVNRHHSGIGSTISVELIDEDRLAEIMSQFLTVDVKISDLEKYVVSGLKE